MENKQKYILTCTFIRGEEIKFQGHLDMMKTFERAIRRSQIPISFSEGFNPHPEMVIGMPLSVGVTSGGELADFSLTEKMDADIFIKKINDSLPDGIKVIKAVYRNEKGNCMAQIKKAEYIVLCSAKEDENTIKNNIDTLLKLSEIKILKKSKSGIKKTDIKPLIYKADAHKWGSGNESVLDNKYLQPVYNSFKNSAGQNGILVFCTIAAGGEGSLKPELFIEALKKYLNIEIEIKKIHRISLLT